MRLHALHTYWPSLTYANECGICGLDSSQHVDAKPESGAQYRGAKTSTPQPLRTNGHSGGFSSTRSRGGRPRLTKEQRRLAEAKRRERNAQWMAAARSRRRDERKAI